MKKFNGVSDSTLFELWKKKDVDAENEFIERYREFSVGLADSLLEDFKNVTNAEKDDLVGIGLFSLFVALEKFQGKGKIFYPYWKKIATNRMMDEIKANSYSYLVRDTPRKRPFVYFNDDAVEAMGFECSGLNTDEAFVRDELIYLISREELDIPLRDQHMFLLYIDGYNYAELALIFNTPYGTVRGRIERIKRKMKKYFV